MIIVKLVAGLGNQLLQYATGLSAARYLNTIIKLDISYFSKPKDKRNYLLDRIIDDVEVASNIEINQLKNFEFDLKYLKPVNRIPLFPFKKSTHLREREVLDIYLHKPKSDNYYIEGWFGNEKYFVEHKNEIVDKYNADYLFERYHNYVLGKINNTNSVAVHIRRGDYLNNSYFLNLPVKYYYNSIAYIEKLIDHPEYFFFTDDIQWVKKIFPRLKNYNFIEHQNSGPSNDGIEDLMLMRYCRHQIIANSTFSWWAAWLNNNSNKIVLFPERWHQDDKSKDKEVINNFIPEGWINVKF